MVCAHDSSIRSLRVTSKRPKVIKLHGDFLFDDIKNTVYELESLEGNIREKLKHISSEFALIVVGYAGNDRSIMDCLNTLLKSDGSFPHGVYWCVRKGGETAKLSHKLEALCRYPRVHIIEIDGFDEFFANLHNSLDLDLQPELSDPYQKLADKLNALLEKTRIPSTDIHPVIEKDIARLGTKLSEMSRAPNIESNTALDPQRIKSVKISTGTGGVLELPIPYSLLAQISEREGAAETALTYMKLQLSKSPRAEDFIHAIRLIRKLQRDGEVKEFIAKLSANRNVFAKNPGELNTVALELIHMEEYEAAQDILRTAAEMEQRSEVDDDYIRMNMIQILRHQKANVPKEDLQYLRTLERSGSPVIKLGAKILLEKQVEATDLLKRLLTEGSITLGHFREWPIFKLLPVDVAESGTVIENLPVEETQQNAAMDAVESVPLS